MKMKNINLWNSVIKYLNIKDIIQLSLTNKRFNADLNNKINLIVNNKWREFFDQKFYRISEEKTEKEELNNSDEGLKIDFKLLFYKFLSCKNTLEKLTVSEDIFDILKSQCYLLKIRKSNKLIEYSNSSLHQTYFYDIQKNENSLYKFYNNFFNQENKNLLNNDLEYEEIIYDYKQYAIDIFQSQEKMTLMNKIIYYENLEDNCNKNYNNQLLNFILWIYQIITLFCIFNRAYIQKYENNSREFLNEYNKRHNSLVRIAMYLNDNYQNINVAFNYIYFYCFGNVDKKFNLYKMIFNIWYQKSYIPLNEKILSSSEEIFKSFLEESSISRESINGNSMDEEEVTNIEIINEILKNVLDFSIDENNVNYINHSKLPVNDYYKNFENMISNCYISYLQNQIVLRSNPNELIDYLNTYFKSENENYFYDEKNIQLINRSIIIILTNIVKSFNYFLQNELLNEFNNFFSDSNNFQNANNSYNSVKIESNFEENVKIAIQKEILNFKNYLLNIVVNKNVNITLENINNMVNYFIQKSSVIIFINKLSGFYYEKKNNLEEITKKIENFLRKKITFNIKINFDENLNSKIKIQNFNESINNGIFVNNS